MLPSDSDSTVGPSAPRNTDSNRGGEYQQAQTLQKLLNHPAIWQAKHSSCGSDTKQTVQTGFPALNQLLHGRGWPCGALIECLQSTAGIQNLYPFMPALKTLSTSKTGQTSRIFLISPPFIPCASGWQQHGIDVRQLWVIKATSLQQQLWAAEQVLHSGCSAALLMWPERQNLPSLALRKLQLAARYSQGMVILFREAIYCRQASCASLRLEVTTRHHRTSTGLVINLLKQPGSWGGKQARLSWHSQLQNVTGDARHWPVYSPVHSDESTLSLPDDTRVTISETPQRLS